MSRKSRRNAPQPAPAAEPPAPPRAKGRRGLVAGAIVVVLLAFVGGVLVFKAESDASARQSAARSRAHLASEHAPALGQADAKVHIVEFLDPACETCAIFFPHVKRLMAASPERIRLSVRHIPLHKGSGEVIRILEAARAQEKYWQALEALLASQDRWTVNHKVYPERVWPALEGLGLDLDRVRAEMNSPEVVQRIERDLADARALGVSKTPEYFVNGRPLPRFGLEELQGLVREELRSAYGS